MEHWKTPPTPWIFKLTGSSDNLSLLLLLLRELTLKIPPWRPHPVSSHVWFCVLYTIFYFENAGAAHVPCVPLANCGGTDGLLMFAEHTHTHTNRPPILVAFASAWLPQHSNTTLSGNIWQPLFVAEWCHQQEYILCGIPELELRLAPFRIPTWWSVAAPPHVIWIFEQVSGVCKTSLECS